ncbi:MAG: glycine zipper domain-containing protein [Phycisphaerae bacterium]
MSDTLTSTKVADVSTTTAHSDELRRKYTVAKSAVADLAGEVSKTAADRVGEIKAQTSDWVHDKAEIIRERASDSQTAVITLVRRNPLAAVAIAAGAGLLLGMLIRRRH